MLSILLDLSHLEVARISDVAVKCIDIRRNTNCEGRLLQMN